MSSVELFNGTVTEGMSSAVDEATFDLPIILDYRQRTAIPFQDRP